MGDLTKRLSRSEFACRCGCGFDTVDHALPYILEEAADYFEDTIIRAVRVRIHINSGCRCPEYNREIGGSEKSQHTLGRAADFTLSIEKADGGYARGYMHALTYWREIVDQLTSLRSERQMAVILIAHSKVERVEDPLTTSYDRYSPRLHKHASALLGEWVDGIFFAHWKYHTRTEDTGFGRERSIAVPIGPAGDDRVLRTVGSPAWVAKNRFGLPAEIPLSWHAFSESLSG